MARFAWLLLAACMISASATAQVSDRLALPDLGPGPVFVVPVEGMIDNALARYLRRAVSEAEAQEAALILFHMDTFGGLVDAADDIRQNLLDTSIPTAVFIDKNAASAGALISYAADRIVMVPGASIGAATVVEGVGGEAAPDKYQSYMRSQMRATAEANGRDPQIAEAMVDERIEIPGVVEAGKVLTLSASEALRLGVADAVLPSLDALKAELNVSDRKLVQHHASGVEQLLRFLGSPVVASILMLMMMGGLYFELQTPGVGFAGMTALIGAALFFAPHYMLGLVQSWEIVLFIIGVMLLTLEIFLIPGFGVAGIGGVVLMVGSLGFALIGNVGLDFPSGGEVTQAVLTMAVTLVLLVGLIFSVGRYLPRSDRFNHLVLQPELSSATGYVSADTHDTFVGKTGRTVSALRPSGTIEVDGERVDALTRGEYIPAGATVEVVKARGSYVEVRVPRALPETASTIA